MASFQEVNSFVTKFLSLWHTGRDACLQIETQSGKAFVNLRLGLGEHPHHQQHHHRKESPSKQRRRDKRAAERLAKAEEADANSDKNAEEAQENSLDGIDATEKVVESLQGDKTAATACEVVEEVCKSEQDTTENFR